MTTTLHIKTDKKVKDKMERFANANGLTLTAFANLAFHDILNRGQLTIHEPLIPNAKTAKELKKILKDADSGKNMSPTFENMGDAINYLDSLRP